MAVELIRHTDSRLDRAKLVRFINSFQAVAPLTIGELWAWPSMLRLALIENLRRLAAKTLEGARRAAGGRRLRRAHRRGWTRRAAAAAAAAPHRVRRAAPAADPRVRARGWRRCARRSRAISPPCGMTSEDAIRAEHQEQAAAQVSVANVIGSLRLCAHARLERVLRGREPGRARAAAGPGRRLRRAWTSSAATATGRRSRSSPTRAAMRRCGSPCARSRARARPRRAARPRIAPRTSATT